jgi:hypothetical protein
MMKSKAEIDRITADRGYWKEFADAFGWRIYGFSYRHTASIITGPDRFLEITGRERDTIIAKLAEARKP